MASYNTSLINTSNTGLLTPQQANEKTVGLTNNTRNKAYTQGVKNSLYEKPTYDEETLSAYTDEVMNRRFSKDFTTALSKQAQKYNEIAEYYKNFYTNGISYDKNGNAIQGADALSYADRYQFAEFLHELYPELSVDYFVKNAENFMYRATGVRTDIKNYGDHLGNIWNASWKNAGYSIWTAMEYLGGALSGGFGSVEWENTKKELAKKKALSGADYRKDLGDERYDSLAAKMLSGTIEQSPQMAMMLATMAVSIATGGLSGAGGIVGKLALNSMSQAAAVGNTSRIAMTVANFVFSGLMDAGSFMTELSDAGASDEAAFIAGLFILASTGFLETWGDDTLLAPVDKVANAIFKKKDSQIINSATKSAMKIIRETGFNWLMDIGASEITETVQEEVEYLAEVFAKELVVAYEAKYGNMLDKEELGITGDQVIESMKETARQTLLSTPLMTLGSNVIATGLDIGWGDIAAQRRPNKYMNKEGATNIRGTSEFVAFGPDIVDPNKQDADNGKANPIKAHTVGNYTFIDEKLSQQQYDLLTKGENKGIYTVEDNSKFTDKSVVTLETEAIETGVKMTADTLDSYLATIDKEGNLDSYGYYSSNGKITPQNTGDATTLYITLKDSQETIKIDIADKNSSEERLNTIKDFTNVDFSEIERTKRDESTIDEDSKKKKKEKKKKKKKESTSQQSPTEDQSTADTTTRRTEGSGTTWRDTAKTSTEPAPDMFAGTSKETVSPTPQTSPQDTSQTQEQTTTTEPAKKYATDKAKSSKAFLKQYTSQAFETAEFLDKDGNVVPNATSGAYIALTDSKGNTEVVRTEKLSDSTVRRILSTAKSSQVDPKQARTDNLKDTNKGATEAQAAVGVDQTGSPAPETIGMQTEKKRKTEQAEAVKAEKAKNAESFFANKDRFPGLQDLYDDGSPRNGTFDVEDMFDGTYELVNDKGQRVNTLEEASAFIGKGKDGKEVVFSTKQILKNSAFKEQYELYVSEAKQVKAKTVKATESKVNKVTKAQFNSKTDEVVKTTGVSRKSAEDSVLIAIGAMNALEKSGVKVTLDEATQQVLASQLPLEIETAPDDGKSHLESDVNKVVTLLQSLDKQGAALKKIMEKPSEKVQKAGSLSSAVLSYIQNDMTHADLPDSTILIFDEIKETVRALYENNSTTLSAAEQEDLKLLKGENDSKKEDVKPQGSAEAVTVDEGGVVDTKSIQSSYRYNEDTGKYYIDRDAVAQEFKQVLIAANNSLNADELSKISDEATLAAIFLTSLSEEAQDALVRRSIASNGNGSLLGGDVNLLRLFFTFKEVTQALPNNSKGASLPESAKILLSSLSDKSTVVHEVGHILWSLDENFRNRAKAEFKKYFAEDPTGAGIRKVVEASPSRFGGMTADTVIEALRKLTDENFDYLKESKTEESVMYMFEAWDEERETPEFTKGIKGLFERIAEFFRDVADKIKRFFGVDILHETTNAVYSPLFGDVSEYRKFSEKLATEGWVSSQDSNTKNSRRLVVSEDGHTEVWGQANRVMCQTMEEYIEAEQQSKATQKITSNMNRFKELVFYNIKEKLLPVNDPVSAWRRNVEKKRTFAEPSDINQLIKIFENNGLYDVINNQKATEVEKEKFKREIAQRFAYEFEDYTTFATKVGEFIDNLVDEKGKFKSEDSLAMKKALFFLYGYKKFTNKDGSVTTTASGLLSRMFMNDSAKSLYQSRASEGIMKKFTVVKDNLAEKGIDIGLDNDTKRVFLTKKTWANKTTNGMQLTLDSNLDYSSLDFKLSDKGISTEDVYNFLSLMVEKTEDGYIPFAWRESNSNLDEGQAENSFAIQGPLIDILNYDHKDHEGFTGNSFNTVDSTYATTAYNTFYNAGIPLMEGTLSYSSTLLDQYKTDYLTAYEVLKGSNALNEILDNGISITELEVLRKLLGESIAETKTEITEADNVEELFKTSTSKSDAIFEIDSILKEMGKQEKGHIEISKESLKRFQDVLTSYQADLNADSQKQFEESLKAIEEKSKEREERLQAEAEKKEKRASKTADSLKDKVSSLELELEEEKSAHQTDVQNVKDRLNAKIDEIVEKNAERQEKTKQRYEEKLAQKSELLKNSREKVSDLIAQRQTARQRANEIIEEIFSTGKKIREGSISEDAQSAVKYYQDLLNNLRKEIEKRDKIEAKLQEEITAIKQRLTEKLGVATATAKDFNNAGVLPIFDAGIKELKRVAKESGTAEVSQKLSKIVDTVAYKKNVGTEVDLLDLFDYRTLYTSDNSENFVKYREDMDKLRIFVVDNMMDRGSAPNIGVVSKHVKELNTQQLSEFIDLVSAVSKDSRSYFNDMVEKDNEYYNKWIDSIASEINTFAQLKGKNLSELTNEDSIGTSGSKSGFMGKLGDLMNDFTVNSVKYRDRFPTLYAFLYGGLDHEGKVYGGLNSATDDVARNFRSDVNSINKIIIDKLSGTVFYEKELDDKNLRLKWNEVKSSYKTTLGMSAFTEADKQALGYSVESFIDPLGVKRYRLNIDEDSTSAMKEVARYLGGIELQKIKAKDKLSDLNEKIERKKTAIDNNLRTIANAERNLDYWKTGKYYVTGEKYGQLIEESDRKKQIETLEKRIKNTRATLERNREILQTRQEKVPILEQRIASYDDIGLRPNLNTSNYSTQELLGIYMYARQEGGINRLIYNPRVVFKDDVVAGSSNTNNLDIGNVIWVIKQFEDPTSIYAPLKEVADELTKLASKNFDAIRKTKFFLSNGEVLLDPIDYYFSFITDSSTIIDIQDQIDIGEFGKNAETKPDSKAQRAKANDKMTKERKTNARGLELRVLDRVYSSLYQQEYYISMGERISRLKELVQDERFQSAMKSYYGRNKGMANLVSLSKYVNSLSNSQRDLDPTAISGFVRFWTNNTAAGAMAFSLPTVLQQFPTMLWCLKDPYIGLKGILKALYKASTDKSLYKLSPQMEERANSAIQSIRATKNIGSFFSEKFNNYTLEQAITKTQDAGLKLLDKADSFVANAMWYATFEGVKQEYIEAGKDVNLSPNEFMDLVATEATQRVLDISPVQGGKDNATAYSTNNAFVRNMLLFTNQTTKMLNGLVGSFRDFDVKGWQYLAKTVGVSLAIFMLNGIINGKMWRKTDDDDDDEAHINLLTNIPYVLWEGAIDLVPGADSFFSTDQYGETNIVKDLASIRKALKKDPDDRTEHQLSNAWFNLLSDTLDAGGLSGNALRKVYRAARDQNLLQLYNSKYAELLEE